MPSTDWARFTHRADLYARCVLGDHTAGTPIVAGPLVRLACERHLRDRQRAERDRSWYQFSAWWADHIIDFIEQCLRLPDVVDANGEPQPFILQGWQAFIIGSVFGWRDESECRRFREAYIEAGKGCGKTPMVAAIGLYGLMMDGERAAQIYAAAADQEQASIMFRDAVQIAQSSPQVIGDLQFDGGSHIWQIRHPESLSFFRTFSRESGQKSGTRPHMGLMDELHEHPSHEASVKIRAGAKRRKQPVFIEITNAGYDRTSVCWQRHEHARKVMEGVLEDEQFFGYVCALDEGDDPLTDRSCWIKTNPNLGITPSWEYLERQVANAKNIQAETNDVLRLNFCVWTQQHTKAIDIKQWLACKPMPSPAEWIGGFHFGCLDVGETDDFTSFGSGAVLHDGRVAGRMQYWIPEAALERYPNRPYVQWQRAGLLTVTEGEVTDYALVREAIRETCLKDGIHSVFFDPKSARETAQILAGYGIDMVAIPPGFALSEAIKRFLALVASGDLCHGNDPILTWMASNLVLRTGDRGDKRIDKERAADKIDGIAALVMGIEGAVVRRERKPEPQFQMLVVGGGGRRR